MVTKGHLKSPSGLLFLGSAYKHVKLSFSKVLLSNFKLGFHAVIPLSFPVNIAPS